ncbi:hypothetical protein TNIN_115821 [Trichonephila inaurata madagascariensis]|uniref:Uncharacterized protein n=1 Tax=Trichonephila inaurata madagascariensis TaxID=2747483 RepID=A0A8X7CFN1_9ARAC|nr:hypothetical protein TNIN_115821 [Trichonephila inaurata madagascariensis]
MGQLLGVQGARKDPPPKRESENKRGELPLESKSGFNLGPAHGAKTDLGTRLFFHLPFGPTKNAQTPWFFSPQRATIELFHETIFKPGKPKQQTP